MSELDIIKRWPRYENGEFVNFGDELPDFAHTIYKTVKTVQFNDNGVVTISNNGGSANINVFLRPGERLKRSAPKVLDADGVEIHTGDVVYALPGEWCDTWPCLGMRAFKKMTVVSPTNRWHDGSVTCRSGCLICYPQPSQLTHRAPVIAADGRPLRDGETVWDTSGKRQFKVLGFGSDAKLGEHTVKTVEIDSMALEGWSKPSDLTHERPESLDRLAEDIGAMVVAWRSNKDLFDAQEAAAGCVGENTMGAALDSLVRRAKALAERDA